MRTADHGWLLPVDVPAVVSPASWHAEVEKIFDRVDDTATEVKVNGQTRPLPSVACSR
ncbi:hypothetical protein [Streptomyces sp. NBC_00582]|uniref:hypothetical protein n=1 Tax=Streptomyces sp. NBC_00582 TaxID=2975783 RepID=UPI001414E6B7|nr:hypothetical protein [Streptomyces sp. NBC_00582]WUB59628.1 hypothetical protein OG852_04075 [Streptomyces sp. NBC_00582]